MIKINCDIGERGADHPIDRVLIQHIQIANIACGGHAGDQQSVAAFIKLASENRVEISAHLSYPDRKNFGRLSLPISGDNLLYSLEQQIKLMPGIDCVKFHGALYNDAVVDAALARMLADWLKQRKIEKVITAATSELAVCCKEAGIGILNEAFAERHYALDPKSRNLTLVRRTQEYASITDVNQALDHVKMMIEGGLVNAYVAEDSEAMRREAVPIEVDTICIHSDSEIALDLAKALNTLFSKS